MSSSEFSGRRNNNNIYPETSSEGSTEVSDTFPDVEKDKKLPLINMARNYRSNIRTAHSRAQDKDGDNERTIDDPLESLGNRQEEEFSYKECFCTACNHLYNFTIASCQYAFCDCLRSRKRASYVALEGVNQPDHDTGGNIQEESTKEILDMKAQLGFHFMNPFQKWKFHGRRRFPWKLITQVIVIILVTTQLCVIAQQRFQLNQFVSLNEDTFEQLFVMNPEDADPTKDYYQTSVTSTIVTMDDLWNQLNYTASMYFGIKDQAVGPYGYGWHDKDTFDKDYKPPMKLCVKHYEQGDIIPEIKSYSFQGHKREVEYWLNDTNVTSIREQLEESILRKNFSSIIELWIKFNLSSVYLDAQSSPLCCQFDITLMIKNRIHSGSMPVSMEVTPNIEGCSDNMSSYDPATGIYDNKQITVLESFVLLFLLLSTIQCVRSIIKAARFTKEVRKFFRKHYNYRLRISEYTPLYNWWFVIVVISNVLVALGTILFLITQYEEVHHLEIDDVVSIVYGIGVFLQWCGLLRFLSYFDKYNMLLITLRLALPSVFRFMVCGLIFYIAFLLLGWLVLGPYHPKFKDPSVTSECLFSLVNGDDMFNTYIQMENLSMPAFIFSKIYLYVFISLFIYVVLSVFISLISDTYETLHEQWTVRSRGLLQDFANDYIGRQTRKQNDNNSNQTNDNGFEFLTSSMYSQDNSPLVPNGGSLVQRVTPRNTPTLQLPVSNNSSPRVPKRGLYPDLVVRDEN